MAEKISTQRSSAMDYAEHERTYERFIELTTVGTLHALTIVVALAMFGFGGNAGFWMGALTILLALAAAAISIARKSWKAAAGVLVLSIVLALLSVA